MVYEWNLNGYNYNSERQNTQIALSFLTNRGTYISYDKKFKMAGEKLTAYFVSQYFAK